MNFNVRKIEPDHIFENIGDYEHALVYLIDEILLCKVSELPEVDWDECMEARFFDKEKELHIYEEDGKMQAVEVTEMSGQNCLVKRYQLANRFKKAGNLLRVHEYLGYDDDGQAVVELTRLAGIEGGVGNASRK